MHEGGCLCRAVRYRVDAEPERSGICHCETCRRAASAPSLPYAVFPVGRLAFSKGQPREYASSPHVIRTFCGSCGSPLTYRSEDDPDRIDVMICSLDDPGLVVPSCHVWVSEKLNWDHIGDRLPKYLTSRSAGSEGT